MNQLGEKRICFFPGEEIERKLCNLQQTVGRLTGYALRGKPQDVFSAVRPYVRTEIEVI
jgi:hypothetical protein